MRPVDTIRSPALTGRLVDLHTRRGLKPTEMDSSTDGGLRMKPAALLTSLLLCAIAVLHALRLIFQVEVSIGGVVFPMWSSVIAVLVLGALALWLWREQRQ